MSRIGIAAGAVLFAAAITACGDPEDNKPAAGGSAGMTQASGAAGSAGMPGLMLGGSASDPGPPTIALTPPAKINLQVCKSIGDDQSPQSVGDCFLCCNQAGLVNSGFFQGSCACGAEIEGLEVCAAQDSNFDACEACCDAANYSSAGFSPGPPASCYCDGHTNPTVCAPQSRANCAVCCINAGYITSGYDGTCHCFDG